MPKRQDIESVLVLATACARAGHEKMDLPPQGRAAIAHLQGLPHPFPSLVPMLHALTKGEPVTIPDGLPTDLREALEELLPRLVEKGWAQKPKRKDFLTPAEKFIKEVDAERGDWLRPQRAPSAPKYYEIIAINGNWTAPCIFVGEVFVVNSPPKTKSRKTGARRAIYAFPGKPTTIDLSNWGDKECLIVASGGGEQSEEMLMAREYGILYVNGVQEGFDQLVGRRGMVVAVAPHNTRPEVIAQFIEITMK